MDKTNQSNWIWIINSTGNVYRHENAVNEIQILKVVSSSLGVVKSFLKQGNLILKEEMTFLANGECYALVHRRKLLK